MRRAAATIDDTHQANDSASYASTEPLHPPADTKASREFLQWLRPAGPWRLVAIPTERGQKIDGAVFEPNQTAHLESWIRGKNETCNIYFHVNSVRLGAPAGKAKKEDINRVEFLHVDIDPAAGKPLEVEQARIERLLLSELPAAIPPPSAIIFSGGGFQVFWRLDTPIETAGSVEETERAEGFNKQLAQQLGGDKCHNVDRVMRLPGTINRPTEKKKKAGRTPVAATIVALMESAFPISAFPQPLEALRSSTSESCRASHTELSDLIKWNVPERIRTIVNQGKFPDAVKSGDDSRSAWLFEVVCCLVRCNVPDDATLSIITDPKYGISESVLEKREPEAYARRQIARARTHIAEQESPELQEMNSRHAVIKNYGGKTRILTERQGQELQFQTVEDFCNGHLSRSISAIDKDGVRTRKPLARWWLAHPQSRKYERVEFLPGLEADSDVYNMWRGWPVLAQEGNCDRFLEFIRVVICSNDEKCEQFLLNWMAHAVQRPQEPAAVAVALRGGQGIGKSFFVEHFGELFGENFVPVMDPKHVIGNFNAMLAKALLVFADEAFAANDKRAEGVLKGLVTQPHITIEPKGVDAYKAKKYFRLVLASNHRWIVPAETDDRRFLVLDVSDAYKRNSDYFGAIEREWKSGGREALMHFLRNKDLSHFDFRQRPETKALADQKRRSFQGAKRIVYEMLFNGSVPVLKVDGNRIFVATRELKQEVAASLSEASLGLELGRISVDKMSVRETCDGKQRRGYWLPSLAEARAEWARTVGVECQWPDDDGQWESVEGDPLL